MKFELDKGVKYRGIIPLEITLLVVSAVARVAGP